MSSCLGEVVVARRRSRLQSEAFPESGAQSERGIGLVRGTAWLRSAQGVRSNPRAKVARQRLDRPEKSSALASAEGGRRDRVARALINRLPQREWTTPTGLVASVPPEKCRLLRDTGTTRPTLCPPIRPSTGHRRSSRVASGCQPVGSGGSADWRPRVCAANTTR